MEPVSTSKIVKYIPYLLGIIAVVLLAIFFVTKVINEKDLKYEIEKADLCRKIDNLDISLKLKDRRIDSLQFLISQKDKVIVNKINNLTVIRPKYDKKLNNILSSSDALSKFLTDKYK